MPTERIRTARHAFLCLGLAALGAGARAQEFEVALDGKPIGTHRFVLGGTAQTRTVRSEASFTVKLLGLTVYRYRHEASERWQGGCLTAVEADTDDNGKPSRVQARTEGGALQVAGPEGPLPLPGCVFSYAYWNPAMRQQTQLLNVQTGRHDAVRIRRMDSGTVEVRGRPQEAERWRIEGPEQPVDVWYTTDGQWVGLDSTVAGGRQLRYRLR
ncbi:hypothetical protein GCM10007320_49500 [Pseudorhodoferax aquiterrae]|uniref:DUF3108 domain-containing protein n=1 Tax=Pseudorhodoferax aquiterrae TaxID=747304 RepID=A0ABQ3G7Y0_9BURK|nr:DUF6134 family protein [Pseudorhodoferax aquiterrae]GHC96009.1 hypothetical protein GCM10007320_49500 [Pseudorhodoferax aquiterrae]